MTAPNVIWAWEYQGQHGQEGQWRGSALSAITGSARYIRADAIDAISTCGDSAVTEALGQRICCNGQMCGCRGATVEDMLVHSIRALPAYEVAVKPECGHPFCGDTCGAAAPAADELDGGHFRGDEYRHHDAPAADVAGRPDAPCTIVEYTNYRGETARRTIIPIKLWWGSTEWHPEDQWMLTAWDIEKGARRDFAWQDMRPVQNHATSAALASMKEAKECPLKK